MEIQRYASKSYRWMISLYNYGGWRASGDGWGRGERWGWGREKRMFDGVGCWEDYESTRKTPPTRKFTLCKCRSDADLWKGEAQERKITGCRQDKYHSELSSRQIQSPRSMLYCVRLGDDEKGKGIVAHPPKSLFSSSQRCFHLFSPSSFFFLLASLPNQRYFIYKLFFK